MQQWRKPPELVTSSVVGDHPAVEIVTPSKPRRLTRLERETMRIEEEQAEAAEGGRRAEAMEREARAAWEAAREREPVGFDHGRFTY